MVSRHSEVLRHQVDHALVAGDLVVGLEAVQHDHVGPEVVRPLVLGARPVRSLAAGPNKPSGLLALDRRLDPDLGLFD